MHTISIQGIIKDIQRDSRVLSGYTAFVEKVRTYAGMDDLEVAEERRIGDYDVKKSIGTISYHFGFPVSQKTGTAGKITYPF